MIPLAQIIPNLLITLHPQWCSSRQESAMPPHHVSNNLKARIPVMYKEGFSVKYICHLLGVKKTLIYSVLWLYKTYHYTSNPFKYLCCISCPRSLSLADFLFLAKTVECRGLLYLDEYWNITSAVGTWMSSYSLQRLKGWNLQCHAWEGCSVKNWGSLQLIRRRWTQVLSS